MQDGAVTTDRDRDTEGRARNVALGEAQELLDAARPFHAHEVLEDAWKSAPEAERQLWRGLAQLAVGLTHAMRGNARGAATLLDRGAGNIAAYTPDPPHGIDVAGLDAWARGLADDAVAGRALDVRPPRLLAGPPPRERHPAVRRCRTS
jgi:hypothetical protein